MEFLIALPFIGLVAYLVFKTIKESLNETEK